MTNKRIDYITPDEFKQLYKAEKDKRMKLFILLSFGSGLRISEIVGFQRRYKYKQKIQYIDSSFIPPLTKDNIDLEKHQITINNGKGNKWRVTITPPLLDSEMIKLLPITLKRRTINNRLAALSNRILGKRISPHTLRHGFGNYQANILNIPLPIVQSMLGHSRLDTTGIYTRANPTASIGRVWEEMTGEEAVNHNKTP